MLQRRTWQLYAIFHVVFPLIPNIGTPLTVLCHSRTPDNARVFMASFSSTMIELDISVMEARSGNLPASLLACCIY